MNVFGSYARYYDLLYSDKNYSAEAGYVGRLIRKHAPEAESLLELGCGTGAHAQYLAEGGFSVHGVDQSAQMLEAAQSRRNALAGALAEKLSFSQGDARSVRFGRTFDGIISLFHVISYQAGNADIDAVFQTARRHLLPGGVFVFDCWYGPAVLSDPPTVRVKRLEDDAISVTRIAEPVMHPNQNLVDVVYTIFIKDKNSGRVDELQETHRMRYLFRPEIELFCLKHGFSIVDHLEWMTDDEPGFHSWNSCFVVKG